MQKIMQEYDQAADPDFVVSAREKTRKELGENIAESQRTGYNEAGGVTNGGEVYNRSGWDRPENQNTREGIAQSTTGIRGNETGSGASNPKRAAGTWGNGEVPTEDSIGRRITSEFVEKTKNSAVRDDSGNGQVYTKTVPLEDVAWIDSTQGQYAKVETPKAGFGQEIKTPPAEKMQEDGDESFEELFATGDYDTSNETEDVEIVRSLSLLERLRMVLNGTYPKSLRQVEMGNTPDVITESLGLSKSLPLVMPPSKARSAMVDETQNDGYNHHALGPEGVAQIPAAMKKPLRLIKQANGRYGVLVSVPSRAGSVYVVLKIDARSNINGKFDKANVVITAFGADKNYVEGQLADGEEIKIKEPSSQVKEQRKLLNVINEDSSSEHTIAENTGVVNTPRLPYNPNAPKPIPQNPNARQQPSLPRNPNAPQPIPQNPVQGNSSGTTGFVANPELVEMAGNIRDAVTPAPNPEGSRAARGSVVDEVGRGEAAFAPLNNLLAQADEEARNRPDEGSGVAEVLTAQSDLGDPEADADLLGERAQLSD